GPRPRGQEGAQVGADALDGQPGDKGQEVHPVGADVGDGAQGAALRGQHAQVEVAVIQQPVLAVRAGDVVDGAQFAGGDALPGLQAQGIEADVVADGGR